MRRVQNLLDAQFKCKVEHGGSVGKGVRKSRRPLATKKPMLITFKSSLASGELSLHRHQDFIRRSIAALAAKFGVKVYKYSINSNHLHLLTKGETRIGLHNFLRTLPALIARKVTGATKGKPFGKKFWDQLVHSRIVEWQKAFTFALQYIVKNQRETSGDIPFTPRKRKPAIQV